MQILHYMHIPLATRPKRRPYDRIPSHNFLNADTRADMIAAPTIVFFSALYLIAWNSHFPTAVEKLLWRIASVNTLAYALIGAPLSAYFQKNMFRADLRQAKAQAMLDHKPEPKRWIGRLASKLRNIDPNKILS